MNSREKGKRAERQFAAFCREQGFDARRGQQYSGIGGEDVVGLDGIHVEVKWRERLNIQDAMEQSVKECQGNIPIVAHRRNRREWLVTMRAGEWLDFYKKTIGR